MNQSGMKRYFSSLNHSIGSAAATSDATVTKKQRADMSQLEINAQLVTLDNVLEPPIKMNDVRPANLNVDPVSSPELHKIRLRASLRGARCIAQIREGRLKSEAEFMNEYYVPVHSQVHCQGGSSMAMPAFCRCGCGRRVSQKGMLTKPYACSRKGYTCTSIDLKRMTRGQLRRLNDPDSLLEQYLTTPRAMRMR